MSIEELRRSSRVTKGIPPIRLGNEDEGVPKSQREQHEMARENGNHEKQSITSKGTRTTSTSLVRRRNIQAELEAHRKLAEIAKKELEIEKNLIQKELELNRLAELDDIQKGVESVVLEDFSNIKENISEDTSRRRRVKYDEIQQWVDTAPSDNSFNCDFRSIDERPVVNNDVMSRCHYFDTNRRGMNHFMARQSFSSWLSNIADAISLYLFLILTAKNEKSNFVRRHQTIQKNMKSLALVVENKS
ncbi:hypothetical protein JTB14_037515 [Gonioctena quinquepunctata]|nr:hypothetical protein JTB14_037515 [Gonioctena quinquepunctata]